MADLYANFGALAQSTVHVLGRDYDINIKEMPNTTALFKAIHGGGIEAGTSEIVKEAAKNLGSYYEFDAKMSSGNGDLHITSTNYDEPRLLDLMTRHSHVISLHGYGEAVVKKTLLGGKDAAVRAIVKEKLTKVGFVVEDADSSGGIAGLEANNVVNKTTRSMGIQLELSTALRKSFFTNDDYSRPNRLAGNYTADFWKYVNALREIMMETTAKYPFSHVKYNGREHVETLKLDHQAKIDVLSKKTQWVDVKEFGAKGDWNGTTGTDDSDAIQNAINFAETNKLELRFPKGIYRVTKSLIIPSNLKIVGTNGYRDFSSGSMTKWECAIDSSAEKVFIGKTAGTADQYFLTHIDMKNIVIKGKGKTATLFDFFQLDSSNITECVFCNFNYVINGKLTNMTQVFNNYFVNIFTSILSTKQGNVKNTMVDSSLHHNYINGTSEGNSILIDLEYGTYSDVHHNFIDFAYIGIRTDQGSQMNINDNQFDICFKSIYLKSLAFFNVSNNRFGKCAKEDHTLFTALSTERRTELSTNDWIGIEMHFAVSRSTIENNVAYRCNILMSMLSFGYFKLKTLGNLNGYATGTTVKMARQIDTNNVNDGKELNIEEMNRITLTTLPTTTGASINTFSGHTFYYGGKLVRNDEGVFKDMLGVVVS